MTAPSAAPGQAHSYRFEALLGLTALIWGCNFTVVKAALLTLDPHLFNALRFSLSVALLSVFWAFPAFRLRRRTAARIRDRWQTDRLPFVLVIALGLGGHVLYQVLFIEGIARTNAGTTSLLLAGVPLWTAVVGSAMGIDHLSRGAWFGLAVGFAGTVLVALPGDASAVGAIHIDFGAMLVLLASIAWAGYTAFSKPLMRSLSTLTLTLSTMLVGLPVLWLFALPSLPSADWSTVGFWTWAAVVYSGALSTGLAYVLWNYGIQHRGPAHTAVYGNLVPIVGVATGAVFLGEQVGVPELAGGALILVGLLLMRRSRLDRYVRGRGMRT